MQADFARGDPDAGVGVFMDYVFNDPHAWANMSAHGIAPQAIHNIKVPVLLKRTRHGE